MTFPKNKQAHWYIEWKCQDCEHEFGKNHYGTLFNTGDELGAFKLYEDIACPECGMCKSKGLQPIMTGFGEVDNEFVRVGGLH